MSASLEDLPYEMLLRLVTTIRDETIAEYAPYKERWEFIKGHFNTYPYAYPIEYLDECEVPGCKAICIGCSGMDFPHPALGLHCTGISECILCERMVCDIHKGSKIDVPLDIACDTEVSCLSCRTCEEEGCSQIIRCEDPYAPELLGDSVLCPYCDGKFCEACDKSHNCLARENEET